MRENFEPKKRLFERIEMMVSRSSKRGLENKALVAQQLGVMKECEVLGKHLK